MSPSPYKLLILLFLPLICGLLVNALHPEGIHTRLLLPSPSVQDTQAEITIVSADSAFQLLMSESVIFLDTRPEEEWLIDHIPQARSLELQDYYTGDATLDGLPRDATYILYGFDDTTTDATILANAMISAGFGDVMILFGGLSAWLEFGFPTETPDSANE